MAIWDRTGNVWQVGDSGAELRRQQIETLRFDSERRDSKFALRPSGIGGLPWKFRFSEPTAFAAVNPRLRSSSTLPARAGSSLSGCLNRSDAAQREKYLKSAPILEGETQELSHGVNGNIAVS